MLALSLVALLAAADAPVVSVLYFDNDSKDPELESMRKGLADLLTTDLVAWEGVQVVERTRLEDVLKELNFQQTRYVDKATAAKLGKVLNATYLIYGSLLKSGSRLIVQARLVRSADGAVVIAIKEEDERDKIFDLEQRLANQLVTQIDAKLSANAQARRKARVPDLATVIAYGKALDLADQGKVEEAQAAMRAVVSKAPAFLLGRERQQEFLKAFEEYQKRKRDLVTGAIVELGAVIDQALKDEAQFDGLDKDATEHFLSMRLLKARYLARVLKQHFVSRSGSDRVARKGKEGQALLAMRDWVENQRRFSSERDRAVAKFTEVHSGVSYPFSPNFRVSEAETKLVDESKIGDHGFGLDPDLELFEFAFRGRVTDGESFHVMPVFASADPKEGKALTAQLDLEIARALARHQKGERFAQNEAFALMDFKADLALWRGDVDGTITADQALLDAFPSDSRSHRAEERIKKLLEGAYLHELNDFQVWDEALKTCDGMKINMSSSMLERKMRQSGLKAFEELTSELEKACPPNNHNRSGYTIFYGRIAHAAADAEDCDRYRTYYRRYLELGGSVSEMLAYARNMPWCELGELKKDLTYLKGWLHKGTRELAMERHCVSVLSTDDTVLTLMASAGAPMFEGAQEESFDLRFERQPDGKLKCTQARWRRYWGTSLEGTCNVTFSKQAPRDAPGFDEGTFEAFFPKAEQADKSKVDVEITRGEFRVRRQ